MSSHYKVIKVLKTGWRFRVQVGLRAQASDVGSSELLQLWAGLEIGRIRESVCASRVLQGLFGFFGFRGSFRWLWSPDPARGRFNLLCEVSA